MQHNIRAQNAQNATALMFSQILQYGSEVPSRNGVTKELLGTKITIHNPEQRFLGNPHRLASPIAQVMESLWVLAGRNDIQWLKRYLHRAGEFSDDGEVWRAGYGPRLRSWGATNHATGTDQLMYVVKELERNPGSRQAVISLWDPESEALAAGRTKDMPCNNWLQFLLRDGRLHMLVTVRSNDAMWGWSGINQFEWSLMQEMIANSLSCEIGTATYFVGSLHLYEQHWERARKVVAAYDAVGASNYGIKYDELTFIGTDLSVDAWDALSEEFWDNEERAWTGKPYNYDFTGDEFLRDALRMAHLHGLVHRGEVDQHRALALAGDFECSDAMLAVQGWVESFWDNSRAEEPKRRRFTHGFDIYTGRMMGMIDGLSRLQAAKDAVYQGSWKRRGELVSIFGNIARKWDRLESIWAGTDAGNETVLDTYADLINYCCMYADWLIGGGFRTRLDDAMREALKIVLYPHPEQESDIITEAQKEFAALEDLLLNRDHEDLRALKFRHALAIATACGKLLLWEWENNEEAMYQFVKSLEQTGVGV